jgi:hypothetical protein
LLLGRPEQNLRAYERNCGAKNNPLHGTQRVSLMRSRVELLPILALQLRRLTPPTKTD